MHWQEAVSKSPFGMAYRTRKHPVVPDLEERFIINIWGDVFQSYPTCIRPAPKTEGVGYYDWEPCEGAKHIVKTESTKLTER